MVSKNQIKLITSLQQKKYRKEHKLFVAEGRKVIQELLRSHFELEKLFATSASAILPDIDPSKAAIVSESDLKKISALSAANDCLAVFKIPSPKKISASGLVVALDDIRDPGNLGTIVRLCDWFGVEEVVCSEETADIYNPKAVQATMGSIARVNVSYLNLGEFISGSGLPVFGTFMDGENIYKAVLPQEGILIMGNEANGISKAVATLAEHKISIPRFGALQKAESLNVAAATAILLSEFRRNS
ncbi:MAG TPA: RNA methyltransferase [Flavobacterium sp.]|nr:RNA methyltransferase [Flavobacterium sp.]